MTPQHLLTNTFRLCKLMLVPFTRDTVIVTRQRVVMMSDTLAVIVCSPHVVWGEGVITGHALSTLAQHHDRLRNLFVAQEGPLVSVTAVLTGDTTLTLTSVVSGVASVLHRRADQFSVAAQARAAEDDNGAYVVLSNAARELPTLPPSLRQRYTLLPPNWADAVRAARVFASHATLSFVKQSQDVLARLLVIDDNETTISILTPLRSVA